MKVAVTGGTGFLGRYILRELSAAGKKIRAWKRPTSPAILPPPAGPKVEWIDGALNKPESFEPLVAGVDAVVHAALARPNRGVFLSSGDVDLLHFAELNLLGSLRLMQAARKAGVGRFLFISTCAVHDVILDDRPLDEKHPTWARSHYGAHKAALEQFVYSYGLGEGWPICSLRPCGIYGLADPPQDSKFFSLIGKVLAGEPIATPRGGKEVHAADVARAVDLLLHADAQAIAGQAFNCCDRYVADEQVAEMAKRYSGVQTPIQSLNKGPQNQIQTGKLRGLGFEFGGEALLRRTVEQLVDAHPRRQP